MGVRQIQAKQVPLPLMMTLTKAGKIEGRRRRGNKEEMAGWHRQLSGHEFEQALRDC